MKHSGWVIATMHQKEQVIQPLLLQLGYESTIAGINTDQLGTFTGEMERVLSPKEAAIAKCELAIQATGIPRAIASEGSFGPHPDYPWIAADEEWIVSIDKELSQMIVARVLSTDTNFDAGVFETVELALQFANTVKFPSHGLIAKAAKENYNNIVKGIISEQHLIDVCREMVNTFGSVYLETDMRALFNPSRMNVIEQAMQKWVEKYQIVCPACKTPGFDIVNVERGLPCLLCSLPTSLVKSSLRKCNHCAYESSEPNPQGKKVADPMYCNRCNP